MTMFKGSSSSGSDSFRSNRNSGAKRSRKKGCGFCRVRTLETRIKPRGPHSRPIQDSEIQTIMPDAVRDGQFSRIEIAVCSYFIYSLARLPPDAPPSHAQPRVGIECKKRSPPHPTHLQPDNRRSQAGSAPRRSKVALRTTRR